LVTVYQSGWWYDGWWKSSGVDGGKKLEKIKLSSIELFIVAHSRI
jgi:hypothetical protein